MLQEEVELLIAFVLLAGSVFGAVFLATRAVAGVLGIFGIQNDPTKGILDRGKNFLNKKGEARKQRNAEQKQLDAASRLARDARTGGAKGVGRRAVRRATGGTLRDRARTGTLGVAPVGTSARARKRKRADTLVQGNEADLARKIQQARVLESEDKYFNTDVDSIDASQKAAVEKAAIDNATALITRQTSQMGFVDKMNHLQELSLDESASSEQRRAAITMITKNKQYGRLASIQGELADRGSGGAELWRKALGDNYSDFKELGAGLTVDLSDGNDRVNRKTGEVTITGSKNSSRVAADRLVEMAKLDDKTLSLQDAGALREFMSVPVIVTDPATGATVNTGDRGAAIAGDHTLPVGAPGRSGSEKLQSEMAPENIDILRRT